MRHPALSKGRPPTPEPLPGDVLRGGHVLYGGVRRLRARYMALPAVDGHHDMRRSHSTSHSGKSICYLKRILCGLHPHLLTTVFEVKWENVRTRHFLF